MNDKHYPAFHSNAEYLDSCLTWLKCRRLRVEFEKPGSEASCKASEREAIFTGPVEFLDIVDRENAAWHDIQQRLEASRYDADAPHFGLEALRTEHRLDDGDLLVLLAVAICAISPPLATAALGPDASTFGLSVDFLMDLLVVDPGPEQIDDWLKVRTRFQTGNKLMKLGLVHIDGEPSDNPKGNPGELLENYVHITNRGFKAITGMTP